MSDETRDELAKMDGWTYRVRPFSFQSAEDAAWADKHFPGMVSVCMNGVQYWEHADGRMTQWHPIPPTLDAAAAALPVGWRWFRRPRGDGAIIWIATSGHPGYGGKEVTVPDTGNEKDDRYALALAARRAERGEGKHD